MSVLALLTLGFYMWDVLEPSAQSLSSFVDEYILEKGVAGMLFFTVLSALLSCFFVPRQVLSFVGGYAYGVFWGTLLVTVGASVGCLLTFLYTRFLGFNYMQKKFHTRILWLENLFSKNAFGMALTIRILPVGSNVLLNMLAGVSKIPLTAFCFGSAIGFIPQNLVSALLGSGLRVDPFIRVGFAALLYGGGLLFGLWLFTRFRPQNGATIKSIIHSLILGKPLLKDEGTPENKKEKTATEHATSAETTISTEIPCSAESSL